MDWGYPSKDILETNSKEIKNNKDLYNLSNIIYKKYNNKKLTFPIGKNINDIYYLDLENISSIFITGETGSGKSNFIHSMLISLLLKNNTDELKLVLIDPKQIELLKYKELAQTYKLYGNNTLNSLKDLTYVITLIEERKKIDNKNYPHILVIIDEISDIMDFKYTDNILDNIISVAKNYKIHLVLSTNMDSQKYINKKILNKFDYIISFDLSSSNQASYIKMDGANLLKSNGDALIKTSDDIINIQTPYVSENDINNVINYINKHN